MRYPARFITLAAIAACTTLMYGCDWIYPPHDGDDDQPPVVRTLATGLHSPLGLEIDDRGRLWIAEAGTGQDDSRISIVNAQGDVVPFMTGLPSSGVQGEISGTNHVLPHEGRVYIVVGESPDDDLQQTILAADASSFQPGDEPLAPDDAELVAEVGAYALGQGAETSNPYRLAWNAQGLLVTDAGANALFRVGLPSGEIAEAAAFEDIPNPTDPLVGPPTIDPVPTGLVVGSRGTYVSTLTGFPFVSGLARVYRVPSGGQSSIVADSLTLLVDIAQNANGRLFALQHAAFDLSSGFEPETGQVIELTEDGPRPVVTGLDRPTALRFDRAGRLYITTLGGELLRVRFQGRLRS